MYFYPSTLRKIAPDAYKPGQNVNLRAVSVDPGHGLADVMLEPGQMIRIICVGNGQLHFHCHGWSGKVTVFDASGAREHTLYEDMPGERWISFTTSSGSSDLIIYNSSNPDAGAKEIWLKGIAFDLAQPWLPLSLPASSFADMVFGEYGNFIVPHVDNVIGMSIKNTGSWAKKDIDFFERHVGPGDIVFDVGANIGHHSVCFSKIVGESGKVFMFEPQSNIYKFACGNLAINGCRNVIALQGGLGETSSNVRMSEISYDQENNFGALGVSFDDNGDGEEVAVWMLDELVGQRSIQFDKLDFMKIDVQSFELYVIKGGIKTIQKYKPKIFMEISPYWMELRGYQYTEIYGLLKAVGYKFEHFSNGMGVVDGVRQWSGDKSEEWDVYCVPQDI